MRFILYSLFLLPLAAFAADYSASPMLVVQQPAPTSATEPAKATGQATNTNAPASAVFTPDFPEWAITKAGENSAGNTNPVPLSPAAPTQASVPAGATSAPTAAAPAAPASPPSPITKLWPIDTIPIFMKSCMGFHIELAAPCKCVITNLMVEMPHDEFLQLSASGAIENDKRLASIRYRCIGTPNQKPE